MAAFRNKMVYEIVNGEISDLDLNLFSSNFLIESNQQLNVKQSNFNNTINLELQSNFNDSISLESKLNSNDTIQLKNFKDSSSKKRKYIKKAAYFLIAQNNNIINLIEQHDLGRMDQICFYCDAKYFKNEVKSCCSNSLLCPILSPKLFEFENIPKVFKRIYSGEDPMSSFFFLIIFVY